MRRHLSVLWLIPVLLVVGTWSVVAQMGAQSFPPPTIGIASATNLGVRVTVTPSADTGGSPLTEYIVEAIPLRGNLSPPWRTARVPVSGEIRLDGLRNGTVYQVQVAALNSTGGGSTFSALSNTFTPAAKTVPPLDPTITWVLPSWDKLTDPTATNQMAERLRTEIGEGPKAKIGLSMFLGLFMDNWQIDTLNPSAMRAALAGPIAAVDAAIASARSVKSGNSTSPIPIGFSLITAIRQETDGVEAAAQLEDRRNTQWYHDWTNPATGDGLASGWMTNSQYARKMRRIKEAYVRMFGRMLAERMAENPDILVAVTGDGEMEMTYDRFLGVSNPSNPAHRSWADYSPFAVAEFRDWIRGKGLYETDPLLRGAAYENAQRYQGTDALELFNADFKQSFTSWDLKYHNWSLSPTDSSGASDGTPVTGALSTAEIAGGFDAPKPTDRADILNNQDRFWQLFLRFRNEMLQRYNKDFARWITEGTTLTDPSHGGVPYDRWYSAQVPTDVLFGRPPTDLGVRAMTSGSPHWSADIFPYGGMGVTGYNVNGGGAGANGNVEGHYNRTIANVVPLVAKRSARWAIVEWNPADPWSASMDSYRADNEMMRRYRPSLLMPYKINNVSCVTLTSACPEHQWAIFAPSRFAEGLRELMQGQAAVPATQSHPAIPVRNGIAGNQGRGGWLPAITWNLPEPIAVGAPLTSTQLNATANMPGGTFTYTPAVGTAFTTAGIKALTVTFTPADITFGPKTATVNLLVRDAPGQISGRVSSNSTSLGVVASVTAKLINALPSAPPALSTTSAADGTYTLSPLPVGEYFVYFNAPGHDRRAAPSSFCQGPTSEHCPGKTPVRLTAAAPSATRDVALSPDATVSGRVADSAGTGVAGAQVRLQAIDSSFGPPTVVATTGSDGRYTMPSVYPGSYHPIVTLPPGFAGGASQSISVSSGQALQNVNFSVLFGGSISGAVSPVLTGTAEVRISAFSANNVEKAFDVVNSSKSTYTLTGLLPGTYYVKTSGSAAFAHQIYPARPCDGCQATVGDPVTVSAGVVTPNINFALTSGGTLSGRVTDEANAALTNIAVRILRGDGSVAAEATVTLGDYRVTGLPEGTYYARTVNLAGYVDRMYQTSGAVECVNCGPASGTAISVTTSAPATGINFALSRGGSIAGTISGDGSPLGGGTVRIFDAGNRLVDEPTVAGNGTYVTRVGLPTGPYFVRTNNGQGYNDEHYNDNGSIGILPTQSTPVDVVRGQARTLIDFSLVKGGWVTGVVTDSTGQPVGNVPVVILTMAGNVEVGRGVSAPVTGRYQTSAVPAGSYFARADGVSGHLFQYFCTTPGSCDKSPGQPFGVQNGPPAATDDRNFRLPAGGKIAGKVSALGSADIPAGVVEVYATTGVDPVAHGIILPNGTYETSPGLPTGSYFVRTRNTSGFPDVLYDASASVGTPTAGKRVAVTAGQTSTGINFDLPTGGRIRGVVRDSSFNVLKSGEVSIHAGDGNEVARVRIESDGGFVSDVLRAGDYFARATSRGFQPEVYLGKDGAKWPPASGRKITIVAGQDFSGVDFSLVPGPQIQGTVTTTAGVRLDGVTVEAYTSTGNFVTSAVTDENGIYRIDDGLTGGESYRLRTRNNQRLIDRRYPSTDCGPCEMTVGDTIAAANQSTLFNINFTLSSGRVVGGTVTRSSDGAAVEGVLVRVMPPGAPSASHEALTNHFGEWKLQTGVVPGDYIVRTSNSLGLTDEVYNNKTCQPCNPAIGDLITVGAADVTGINFALDAALGSVTGVVRAQANTSVLVAGVRMRLYTKMGSELHPTVDIVSDSEGRYTFRGVPAGEYFVKADPGQGVPYVARVYRSASGTTKVTSGTPVYVAEGQIVSLDPMDLEPGTTVIISKTFTTVFEQAVYLQDSLTDLVYLVESMSKQALVHANVPLGRTLNVVVRPRGIFSSSARWTAADVLGTITTEAGVVARLNLDLPPCVVPSFTTTSLANGRAGVAYAQSVAATGGTGPLSYLVADGFLPPGLTLNASTGAITGIPTAFGTGNFTLGAQGTDGCTATREFYLTTTAGDPVNGTATPSSLRFAAVKNGAAGALTGLTAAQTVSVTFSAGVSPGWTVSASQPWLSLSTTGGTGAGSITASVVNPSNVIGGSTSLSATITVTGTGIANGPLTVPVTLTIDQTNGATVTVPFGQVDTPTQNATGVQGAIGVTGWVLDNVGVTGVKIYRNCLTFDNQASCQVVLGHNVVEVGDAAFLAGARPDVEAAFSTFPQNNRAGWGYLMLTSMLPQVTSQQQYGGQGPLTLYAVATDAEGNRKLLGRSSDPASAEFAVPTQMTMANATIAKPFGAIDTPGQGQTVSGVLNNFGWALTPDSDTLGGEGGDILIPTNGSTMTVFIDSLPVALVAYNQCRGNVGNPVPAGTLCNDDVSNIFGNPAPLPVLTSRTVNNTLFRNLDAGRAPIGVYSFNTSTLSNGLHTIAWSVTDSAGRTEGIGSRFFNVLNSGADPALVGADAETLARADAALRGKPAEVRGPAWALRGLAPAANGVWVRRGFDQSTAWEDLAVDENGQRVVTIDEAGRLDLWLGAPVDAGDPVANGTLRDLPVGASVDGARVTWAPPAGYAGTYVLALVRGTERIEITVRIGAR